MEFSINQILNVMKRIILLLTLAVSLSAFGQKNYTASEVVFYGVDYSLAKAYAVTETCDQLKTAFDGINALFLTEPKKYNVGHILQLNISSIDLGPVDKKNNQIGQADFFIYTGTYEISSDQIQEAVEQLSTKEDSGIGLVIVAELLDKSNHRGTYYAVYFDIETKEVLDVFKTGGKAKGFGLRNYWAGSLLQALKKL